jgi:hypothetical protein
MSLSDSVPAVGFDLQSIHFEGKITLDVIDGIKAEKLKTSGKATVNRYLALVRAILLRSRSAAQPRFSQQRRQEKQRRDQRARERQHQELAHTRRTRVMRQP